MHELKVIQVNYWKEIRKEINKNLGSLHGLVLLTHTRMEFSDIIDFFLRNLRRDHQTTLLYISLVTSYNHIKRTLEKHPLPSKKLYVIDCVSNLDSEQQDTVECVYRKPPKNLSELKKLIMEHLPWSNPNIIIVDSLSPFINFTVPTEEALHDLYVFLKSLKEEVFDITRDTIILLYNDTRGPMKKLPILFTDVVMKLEVIKEKPEWRD